MAMATSRKNTTGYERCRAHLLERRAAAFFIFPFFFIILLPEAMSAIISCINHKGGVGKTTVCAHLGYALAVAHHKRVLLVDMDSQSNLTRFFYPADAVTWSLTDVFAGTCAAESALLYPYQNLALLPASLNLTNIEHQLTTENNYHALSDILSPLRSEFDIILIDCPPSLMTMTMNAMHVSSDICVITTTDRLALEGIGAIIQATGQVQQATNPYLAVTSVIVSHYEQRKSVAREGLAIVQRHFAGQTVLEPPVPYSVSVQEAIWHTKTVFQHKKSGQAAQAFTALANNFAERYCSTPYTMSPVPDATMKRISGQHSSEKHPSGKHTLKQHSLQPSN
jgi:chromosome partitioning protein